MARREARRKHFLVEPAYVGAGAVNDQRRQEKDEALPGDGYRDEQRLTPTPEPPPDDQCQHSRQHDDSGRITQRAEGGRHVVATRRAAGGERLVQPRLGRERPRLVRHLGQQQAEGAHGGPEESYQQRRAGHVA